jgi:hypothetical protein
VEKCVLILGKASQEQFARICVAGPVDRRQGEADQVVEAEAVMTGVAAIHRRVGRVSR